MSSQTATAEWSAFHVFVHGDRSSTDAVFTAAGELGEQLVADDRATAWFAMRYWEGGPHVRLRLRNLTADAVPRVRAVLADAARTAPGLTALDPDEFYGELASAAERTRLGWTPSGTVLEPPYEPERARYADDMIAAEELFQISSAIAVRGVRAVRAGASRTAVGLGLLCGYAAGLLRAAVPRTVVATALRRYAAGFADLDGAPRVDVVAAQERAERDFLTARDGLIASVDVLIGDGPASLERVWTTAVSAYARNLLFGGDGGDVVTSASTGGAGAADPGAAWSAIGSQWHMLANRLGISVHAEVHLSWLVSLAVVRSADAAAMHGGGDEASAFIEATKFRRSAMHEQRPVKSTPRLRPRSSRFRETALRVPLPETDEMLLQRPSLAEALGARRSAYGRFDAGVTLPELATLLRLAAGVVDRYDAIEAGNPVTVNRHSYPAAGGVDAAVLDVVTGGLAGLPEGTYRYDPELNQLIRLGADSRQVLASTSPYSQQDDDGRAAVDVANAAIVLHLHLSTGPIVRRYGQRGLRFALLEAGHLAQNLVLVATALGFKSITLGGFYDDALAVAGGLDSVAELPVYLIPIGHGSEEG